MDFQEIINTVFESVKKEGDQGKPASYIPELAAVDSNRFGVSLHY